ncbi:hypothetical protein CBL_13020 [Carabus blaptoides fortunei]
MFGKLFAIFGNKKANKAVQTSSLWYLDVGTQTDDVNWNAVDASTSTSELQFEGHGNNKRRFNSSKRIPSKRSKFH